MFKRLKTKNKRTNKIGTDKLSQIFNFSGEKISRIANMIDAHKPQINPTNILELINPIKNPAIVPSQDFFLFTKILCFPNFIPIMEAAASANAEKQSIPKNIIPGHVNATNK